MIMLQAKAKIIYNRRICGGYFHCALAVPAIAKKARPGQFLNIKLTDTLDPLLRRPFSVHRVHGASIEILYEALGKGSNILSRKRPGEYLDITGPLGNGFSLEGSQEAVLVAGGMGVAPLLFLAEELASRPQGLKASSKPLIIIGAKTKNHILCVKEFKDLGSKVEIATDDGSRGFKGRATALLKSLLPSIRRRPSVIYACGPRPMLESVALISESYNIPAQVSLEEHMACGIGACLGCAVDTKRGFKSVCKEGPVFLSDEIIW